MARSFEVMGETRHKGEAVSQLLTVIGVRQRRVDMPCHRERVTPVAAVHESGTPRTAGDSAAVQRSPVN